MTKLYVYLTVEGQEQVALGNEPNTWNYCIYASPVDYEGFQGLFLDEVTVSLPPRNVCVEVTLANLRTKEATIHAEAYEEMTKIKHRRNALLCLAMG